MTEATSRTEPERKVPPPGCDVILYHYTDMHRFKDIEEEGLLRLKMLDRSLIGDATPAVCLSDDPTLEMPTNETMETLQRERRYAVDTFEPTVRLEIHLPSNDPHLHKYATWLHANVGRIEGLPDPTDPVLKRALDSWWLYFGDIPPSNIEVFKLYPASV